MIKISGLTKCYKNIKVLDDINLKISEGEIFGLIGTSGAGKSTLLRCINLLEDYQEGIILVNEENLKKKNYSDVRKARKNIGMIFQDFSLLNRENVFDNIAAPLKCWKFNESYIDDKVKELSEIVGISDKLNSRPKELSGGQKQRVAIARSLALEPKILLCDEATSALDPQNTDSILELLLEINKKMGITIVIVTHQMEVIKKVCNRVAVLRKGKIVECDYVNKLFTKDIENLKEFFPNSYLEQSDIVDGTRLRIVYSIHNNIDMSTSANIIREVNFPLSIISNKIEQFVDANIGVLELSIEEKYFEEFKLYLNEKDLFWEVI